MLGVLMHTEHFLYIPNDKIKQNNNAEYYAVYTEHRKAVALHKIHKEFYCRKRNDE
jgi:hypothetical protein